jgi:hypothetical protein
MVRYETWRQHALFPCLRCRLLHPQDRAVDFTNLRNFTLHLALIHGEENVRRYYRLYVVPEETITLD